MIKTDQYITSNNRIKLSTLQYLGHYSFMLVPLILPGIEFFFKLRGEVVMNPYSTITHLICISLSLVIGYFKWKELKFYEVKDYRTDKEFECAILATANKLEWIIIKLENNYVEALNLNAGLSLDYQKITILRHKNRVWINSIIDPGLFSTNDIFGFNRRNRSTFVKYYHQSNLEKDINERVIQELIAEKARIENEPEWNIKNTLKRLVIYVFSLVFIIIAIAIYKYNGFHWSVLIFGVFGLFYIVLDIYILIIKKRKQTHNNR